MRHVKGIIQSGCGVVCKGGTERAKGLFVGPKASYVILTLRFEPRTKGGETQWDDQQHCYGTQQQQLWIWRRGDHLNVDFKIRNPAGNAQLDD